jgi:hypothetical protein
MRFVQVELMHLRATGNIEFKKTLLFRVRLHDRDFMLWRIVYLIGNVVAINNYTT